MKKTISHIRRRLRAKGRKAARFCAQTHETRDGQSYTARYPAGARTHSRYQPDAATEFWAPSVPVTQLAG